MCDKSGMACSSEPGQRVPADDDVVETSFGSRPPPPHMLHSDAKARHNLVLFCGSAAYICACSAHNTSSGGR